MIQLDLGVLAGSDFHGYVGTDVLDGEFDYRTYEELMKRRKAYYFDV